MTMDHTEAHHIGGGGGGGWDTAILWVGAAPLGERGYSP